MALAARFALFSGDLTLAGRLAKKLLASTRGEPPSTPFELEASCIDHWVNYESSLISLKVSGSTRDIREEVKALEGQMKGRLDNAELDMLLLWIKAKQTLKLTAEALNILNQV